MTVAMQIGSVACQVTSDDMQQGAALDEMATVAYTHVMAAVRELAEAGLSISDED